MADDPIDNPVYRALMLMRPDDLAPGAWAKKAGLARNYFTNLREHGNPNNATLDRLLAAINRSRADYDRALQPVRSEVAATDMPYARDVSRAFYGRDEAPLLEVLGTAMGGEYGDEDSDIELTELHLFEVIERMARPGGLIGDDKAYALRIVGDSMAPRFKPGERVGVSPKAPVQIGDDVIVQLRGDNGDGGEEIKMVLIKELARRTATYVELYQHNPAKTFRIETKRIASIHLVRSVHF